MAPRERDAVLDAHQHIIDTITAGHPDAAAAAMVDVIHNGLRRHARIE